MTAPHIVDPARLLGEALTDASPDLMRSVLQSTINALLSADADAVVEVRGRKDAGRCHVVSSGWRQSIRRFGRVDLGRGVHNAGLYSQPSAIWARLAV